MIRASEVADYVYCARAWWLRRVAGLEPDGQARRHAGAAHHARHGSLVRASNLLLVLAGLVLLAALGLLLLD